MVHLFALLCLIGRSLTDDNFVVKVVTIKPGGVARSSSIEGVSVRLFY